MQRAVRHGPEGNADGHERAHVAAEPPERSGPEPREHEGSKKERDDVEVAAHRSQIYPVHGETDEHPEAVEERKLQGGKPDPHGLASLAPAVGVLTTPALCVSTAVIRPSSTADEGEATRVATPAWFLDQPTASRHRDHELGAARDPPRTGHGRVVLRPVVPVPAEDQRDLLPLEQLHHLPGMRPHRPLPGERDVSEHDQPARLRSVQRTLDKAELALRELVPAVPAVEAEQRPAPERDRVVREAESGQVGAPAPPVVVPRYDRRSAW